MRIVSIKTLLISILIGIFLVLAFSKIWAEEGPLRISYIREVENQLYLSDFQLGSNETIRDQDGHGFSLGWLFFDDGLEFFELDVGLSYTKYKGTIEDGVNVEFVPQPDSGFDSLSESKNIIYDVDLNFRNPYVGLNYTNWRVVGFGFRGRVLLPATYSAGAIFQKAEGQVRIKGTDGTEIAKASYRSATQYYGGVGWSYHLEAFYLTLLLRYVTSPVLEIESCNEVAIGEAACKRVQAATGNRNNSLQLFTGGVLSAGILF